jgi:hypothetical protein
VGSGTRVSVPSNPGNKPPRHFSFHSTTFPFKQLACVTIAAVFAGAVLPAGAYGQSAVRDSSAQSVTGTTDVTGGLQYLLQEDDVALLTLNSGSGGTLTTSVATVDTSNSQLGLAQSTVTGTVSPNGWSATGYSNGMQVGRVFAIATDDIGVLSPTSEPAWSWSMKDIATNFSSDQTLTSRFKPYGGVYTQVVMGNFLGNGLSTPLLFYLSAGPTKTEWAMRALTPVDVNTEQMPLTQGPEFYSLNKPATAVPQTGSIVAGDFNGDGKDEIALLMDDNQTIVFYSVDPDSLTITQTATLSLPHPFAGGSGALAAARFRDTTNVELVAAGAYGPQSDVTIYSIMIAPNANNNGFTPSVAQHVSLTGYPAAGVLATAAPILTPLQPTNQQLILGLKDTGASFIEIGSFDSSFNFQSQSFSSLATELTGHPQLLSLSAGNFDHQNSDGTHNPGTQLTVFTQGASSGVTALSVFNLNPQSSNWLQGTYTYYYVVPSTGLVVAAAQIGDLQGRSLRLGAPEVVTLPQQIQPDIVLGLPPMHVDWVTPTVAFTNTTLHPGCNTTTKPCVLNLTVLPSVPAPSVGFSTGFSFSSSANTQASRKSTTSWSVATKLTLQGSITWGVPLISSATVGIKNVTQYAHDHSVANTYNHFAGTTQSVAATTGFADHVFYTEKDMNIYYYPVLGQTACPDTESSCTQKQPEYVAFSVPDQVTHYDLDGTTLEWYQPVHEAGNVLSYPWNLAQLQAQYVNNANPLSENPAPLRGTDSSQTTYTASWSAGTEKSQSSGSSNAVSNDFTFSAAKKGLFVNASVKAEVKGGKSWSTLNENTSSVSASTGIAVNKPAFDGEVATCCLYNFGSYIFGQQNLAEPTFQQLQVPDPNGNPANIQLPGPLFVGFVSDVVPQGGNGVSTFFPQAYSLPDVAVNHPARWNWSKAAQRATFNPANASPDPLDDSFYFMKGFFITEAGTTDGQNLTDATAGDQLSLRARLYNYSLVDTNSGSLQHPAASVHARFYGQFLCHSGLSTENSCVGPNNTTCAAYHLCGNGFPIGETQVASIPGFDSPSVQGTVPNWVLTSAVNFDTTPYANSYLVYWVVTWMEDANGNLIPEMPGHGLKANPGPLTFQQIGQVPVEAYSNNVGMYGVNSPFFIFPAQTAGETAQTTQGTLHTVTLETDHQLLLEQPAKVMMQLLAENGPLDSVVLTYYDGDPRSGGKPFDAQRIAHMDPGVTYAHRAFFHPEACGVHKLYARAWANDQADVLGEFTTSVVIRPAESVDALITSTRGTEMSRELRLSLLALLEVSLDDFKCGREVAGVRGLDSYVRKLSAASGGQIGEDFAKRLIGQAEVVTDCVSTGAVSRGEGDGEGWRESIPIAAVPGDTNRVH